VLRFEWDPRKARENLRKHGVSFGEAVTAFSDDEALLLDDLIIRRMRNGLCCLGSAAHFDS
jgi:uncharacterized DUF497 family protein